jgi:hypothetical protein
MYKLFVVFMQGGKVKQKINKAKSQEFLLFVVFVFPKNNHVLFIIEPGRDDTASREALWWDGVELAPPLPRQGLLAKVWEAHQKKEQQQTSGDY